MTPYIVEDIDRIFWKFAKSSEYYVENWDQLYSTLCTKLNEWNGMYTEYKYSERELVELLVSSFGKYVESGKCPAYIVKDMFKIIYGDNVLEALYGKDIRPLACKIIGSILMAFRLSQIKDNGNILIDFGQNG